VPSPRPFSPLAPLLSPALHQFCAVDPECRMVALHLYNGAVQIIPIAADGSLSKAFNIRLEELQARFFRSH